ncbi:MAG TPA: Hsp70 family protein [Planctomycetota bacterium]|nr:Hsp70 family protein [Planctomycetota bacterium]
MTSPRYVVGIDLGTTHTALAYADLSDASPQPRIHILEISQTVRAGAAEGRALLPSCIYLPAENELPQGSLALPWSDGDPRTDAGAAYTVGEFARARGLESPGRLIASAKSWLALPVGNRRAALLPWNAPAGVPQISPVEATALILKHLCSAWDFAMRREAGAGALKDQKIVLCVPASFDASARELTLDAARRAGLSDVTFLEEPQAAFYAWIAQAGDAWREQVLAGDLVLVIDIGGGTTDFTLISVEDENGTLALRRIAVGEHILLGGDNMDIALAHAFAARLADNGVKLDAWQMRGLALACREAKERLLDSRDLEENRAGGTPAPRDAAQIAILGRGGEVIGKSVTTMLSRADAQALILDGFFPYCEPSDRPKRAVRSGLRELGLNYASDTAITKHLAKFLSRENSEADGGLLADGSESDARINRPTAILYNGGVLKAGALRERISSVVGEWAKRSDGEPPRALLGADLELAVARGAAFYGLVQQGRGVRIRGGVPRSYYIGIDASAPAVPGETPPLKALCVVPFGMEEGEELEVPGAVFGLVIGEETHFRFFTSTTRRNDVAGATVASANELLSELNAIETLLPATLFDEAGTIVSVRLKSKITAAGMLELWCQEVEGAGKWKLELDVKA